MFKMSASLNDLSRMLFSDVLLFFAADNWNGDASEKINSLVKHDLNSPHSQLASPQETQPEQQLISGV